MFKNFTSCCLVWFSLCCCIGCIIVSTAAQEINDQSNKNTISINSDASVVATTINNQQNVLSPDQFQSIIQRFQSYLRIETVQPSPNYTPAERFLVEQGERIGFDDIKVLRLKNDKPIVVFKWEGQLNNLSSIMLNSHTDVVPVNMEKWDHDPFGAFYDTKTGNIFARGSQDMKCVGMQYLESIDRLKNLYKFKPQRTVYVTFVPDEEIGGEDGMKALLESNYFKEMNVGFGMDEGLASEDEAYEIYYGERAPLWVSIVAEGNVGHGSSFIEQTATEKITRVMEKVFEFRRSQEREIRMRKKKSGDVVSINLTSMKAGHTKDCGQSYSMNVIPRTAQVGLDIRTPPQVTFDEIINVIKEWTAEDGVSYKLLQHTKVNPSTDVSDKNRYWTTMKQVLEKMQLKHRLSVFPAATDARFVRQNNIPMIQFSPMRFTKVLLHDHNEYLNDKIYVEGIHIYEELLKELTSVTSE